MATGWYQLAADTAFARKLTKRWLQNKPRGGDKVQDKSNDMFDKGFWNDASNGPLDKDALPSCSCG